ncbi:MAG TPA: hypothetical protein PLV68_02995, partial [Ilumatobacteraceae bacterium]|nr:hypothetical protein [Ilumatobacteraceae bacterium]
MTRTSTTTIRVSVDQRTRLRELADQRGERMAETLDAALETLRRDEFYRQMAMAEQRLRADSVAWAEYSAERDEWLE